MRSARSIQQKISLRIEELKGSISVLEWDIPLMKDKGLREKKKEDLKRMREELRQYNQRGGNLQ